MPVPDDYTWEQFLQQVGPSFVPYILSITLYCPRYPSVCRMHARTSPLVHCMDFVACRSRPS